MARREYYHFYPHRVAVRIKRAKAGKAPSPATGTMNIKLLGMWAPLLPHAGLACHLPGQHCALRHVLDSFSADFLLLLSSPQTRQLSALSPFLARWLLEAPLPASLPTPSWVLPFLLNTRAEPTSMHQSQSSRSHALPVSSTRGSAYRQRQAPPPLLLLHTEPLARGTQRACSGLPSGR